MVCYALDVDIPIQSNKAKKNIFTYIIIAIKRFWLIQSFMPTKLVLLQLAQLNQLVSFSTNRLDCIKNKSLLISPPIDFNRTKSKNFDPDYTKNKNFSNNYCKNNDAKSKQMGGEKVKKDDLKSLEQYGQTTNNFQSILNFSEEFYKIKLVYN